MATHGFHRLVSAAALAVVLCVQPAGAEPAGRVSDGLIVLYDFDEGAGVAVHDVSDVSPAMDLEIEDPNHVSWLQSGGLRVDQPTIIESYAPATKLMDAAMASDELTVEAWILPDNLTQDGPARIVSLTDNPVDPSNFMLGQGRWGSQDPEVIDARCPLNTHLPSTQTPPGSLELELTHVVFTRDLPTATNRIYLNGAQLASSLRVGDFSDWDPSYHLNVVNDQTRDRPWLGTIYLVAIYDRDLSAAEVLQNFAAGPTGNGSPLSTVPALTGPIAAAVALVLVALGWIALRRRADAMG